jgi:hypothetical protein
MPRGSVHHVTPGLFLEFLALTNAATPTSRTAVPRFQMRTITVASRGWNMESAAEVIAETARLPISIVATGRSNAA